jgi:hypothetical protein
LSRTKTNTEGEEMIATKFIEKKVIGNKIQHTYEWITVPVTHNDINELSSELDDPEEAFMSYGVATDYDDDVINVNIEQLVEQLRYEKEEDEVSMSAVRKKLLKILNNKKYFGYNLEPANEDIKEKKNG